MNEVIQIKLTTFSRWLKSYQFVNVTSILIINSALKAMPNVTISSTMKSSTMDFNVAKIVPSASDRPEIVDDIVTCGIALTHYRHF